MHRRPTRCPPASTLAPMIDLGTIAGLFDHDHDLRAHRPRCDRWAALPLAELVRQGKGSLRLAIAVKCTQGGEVGRLLIRPPIPVHPRANGWMAPIVR